MAGGPAYALWEVRAAVIGIVELTGERGRWPGLEEERLFGLRCLRASVPAGEGMKENRRLRRVARGARALARAGVRRVLTAPEFPCWETLIQAGLRPVESEAFCQALAAPLALAALEWQGRPPTLACVRLSGRRVSAPLARAAETLCPRVGRLAVDAGEEGRELAAWLRAEFGAAIQPPEAGGADVALCFGPDPAPGRTVFRLCGPRPDLAGFLPAPAGSRLPAGLDRIPLLALLWETGRLPWERVRILPPNAK